MLFAYFKTILLLLQQNTPTQTYSIQELINNASAHDTIYIEQNIYSENSLHITKPVTLIGKNFPVLDGQSKNEILLIESNDVTIRGFVFRNSGYSSMKDLSALKIVNAQNVRIESNIFQNNTFAIYLANAIDCRVMNNTISSGTVKEINSGNGIHLWKCDSISIENNSITGHRDGIYFEFVTNTLIRKNRSEGNLRYGMHFMFSEGNSYQENIFRNNGAGVAVMYSKNIIMMENTFADNVGASSYGILLKDISDSRIEHNVFHNNTHGIYLEGSNRNQVLRNVFENNGWAAKIQASCYDNQFSKNNFFGNSFDMSTNGTLVMNTFDGNYWDKYEGYDLNKDATGDVPYNPVSLYSMITDRIPYAMLLYRSFMVYLLDRSEKVLPGIIPEALKDNTPFMKPVEI
ncbi:MAG: nitrous oxide reductase family maturation protein NosD [Chitinophagales bacterium]